MKKKLLLALFALTSIVACNTQSQTPPEAPSIKDFGIAATDTTIALGAKIDFAPRVSPGEQNTHIWMVDDKSVGQNQTYSFSSDKTGHFTIKYAVSNTAGIASHELKVTVKKYIGGYFIVNEGQFGKDNGSVNYYEPKTQTLTERVFAANNPASKLGMTTCYTTQWQGSIYFVSKQDARLISVDALSFQSKGSLSNLSGGDGRAFAGVDATWGVVTTSNGAYRVSLNPLAVGDQLDKTSKTQCGGVYVSNDYVFVTLASKGINIYNIKENYKFVKNHPKGAVGFAKSKDGSLWAGDGNTLVKINPATLDIEDIALPTGVTINNSWGAWNTGGFCAAPTENWLYFTKGGMWGGGREIYRYKIGDIASLNQVFATSTVADDNFYGSGISVDPKTGDIVATFVKDGFSDFDDNRLVIFDGATGAEKSRITYKGFFFPSMILSNN